MSLRAGLMLCILISLTSFAADLRNPTPLIRSLSTKSGPTDNQTRSGLGMPTSGTVPFVFEGNRIYAELAVVRPDGTLRKSLAFVDLGSPSTSISPALSKELRLAPQRPLILRVGGMAVSVDSGTVASDPSLPYTVDNGRHVELVLPAGVMRNYQVVIDYAQRALTLAHPGTLRPEGIPIPLHMNLQTGLIAVDSKIDGKSYPITIDCGSAYTWLKKSAAREWLDKHPDWDRGTGAVGTSNMRMEDDGIEAAGTLLRIPEIELGSLRLHEIGALAIGPDRKNGDLIDWYSRKNAAPVIGWLGGNILSGFRITIDYPNQKSYWLSQTALNSHDLDQIGLTLAFKHREYFVTAVATQHGKPTVRDVQVGDKLLQVDDFQLSRSTWSAIFSAMHGKPGDIRTLLLERNGERLSRPASVKEF